MGIVVGTNKVAGFLNETPTIYTVDYMKIHENYIHKFFIHDIGLVHVSEPIKFNDRVSKIALQTETVDQDEAPAILTGWGFIRVILLLLQKSLYINSLLIKFFSILGRI